MLEFYQTVLGRNFYERHVPAIVEALKDLAVEVRLLRETIEKSNHTCKGGDDNA